MDNVKLQFFPPNTTSKSQPMDQGIMQAMKLKYRKRQLQYQIGHMEKDKTLSGPELLKKISVLDAIYWTNNSWSEVEKSTMEKCFSAEVLSDSDDGLDSSDTEPIEEKPKKCTLSRAVEIIEELKGFVSKNGSAGTYSSLMDFEGSLVEMVLANKPKQGSKTFLRDKTWYKMLMQGVYTYTYMYL